jgi:hypothetical protein
VTLDLVAQGRDARLVEWTGRTSALNPVDGGYSVTLAPARCATECLMGGPPLFLVEQLLTPDSAPAAESEAAGLSATKPPASTQTVQTVLPTVRPLETAPVVEAVEDLAETETPNPQPPDAVAPSGTTRLVAAAVGATALALLLFVLRLRR